jgi:hypothetical protein
MFAKILMVLVLISLLVLLTNAQQTNESLNAMRSIQQTALRSLQQTDDGAATQSKCAQAMSK